MVMSPAHDHAEPRFAMSVANQVRRLAMGTFDVCRDWKRILVENQALQGIFLTVQAREGTAKRLGPVRGPQASPDMGHSLVIRDSHEAPFDSLRHFPYTKLKMDGFNEKKWFVYMTDHHEGPFSLEEIQVKLSQAQVTRTHYVWAEGMPDWKQMTEVEAFASILETKPAAAPPPPAIQEPEALTIIAPIQPVLEPKSEPIQDEKTDDIKTKPKSRFLRWAFVGVLLVGGAFTYTQGYLDPALKSPALQTTLQTLSDMTRPYLIQVSNKIPLLKQWISPIPVLSNVSPEDYEELKAAAGANPDTDGPRVAIALSKTDLTSPTFYVASNLPEGTLFTVVVQGVPDTLLNQLAFSGTLQVKLNKRLGQSAALRAINGKLVPRGQYKVGVFTRKDAARPLALKTYFLGGFNDAIYAQRLKEFHDKIRARANAELTEVLQFTQTLESQLTSTSSKFKSSFPLSRKKKIALRQKKTWGAFHASWSKLELQIDQALRKWTPEILQNDYFYGSLYKLIQQTGAAIGQVHGLQDAYMRGSMDTKTFEIQMGAAQASAQATLVQLKSKIDRIEKTPPTPNGLPRREEL